MAERPSQRARSGGRVARLDQHFLQDLFDCADMGKAASLATMMMEELLDMILEGGTRGLAIEQQLRESTLPQKIDLASRLHLIDQSLIAPMQHLAELHQRQVQTAGPDDYAAMALPELDQELRKDRGHEQVDPGVRVRVALCHLLMRLADSSERVSDHEP